mgnify:CR=1 FL=1
MLSETAALSIPLQNSGGGGAGGIVLLVLYLALLIAVVAGTWKAFEKAGEPGWGAIIPIYNIYLMIKIGGNEWWYLLLMLVPLVNILVAAKIYVDLAKAFDQGLGFGLGLWLLPFVFLPILGFGESYQYVGEPA